MLTLSPSTKFYVAGAIVIAVAATAYVVTAGKSPSAPSSGDVIPETVADWCATGLEPIAPNACFAAPERGSGSAPIPLVVYLHGRYTPSNDGEEMSRQSRVAKIAVRRSFAVLALRGRQGQCAAPYADWWCWPSNERTASDGPAFVAGFRRAFDEAERRVGKGRRSLLGFSNGGYFATLIATRALYPFDAIAIGHAGPVPKTASAGPRAPLLLLTSDDDPSNEEMLRLSSELSAIGWNHVINGREGGHDLTDAEIDLAMTFFSRASEPLPFKVPLPTRAPRRTVSEGGTDDAALAPKPTPTATAEPRAIPDPSSEPEKAPDDPSD